MSRPDPLVMSQRQPVGLECRKRLVAHPSGCGLQSFRRICRNADPVHRQRHAQTLAIILTKSLPVICLRTQAMMNMTGRQPITPAGLQCLQAGQQSHGIPPAGKASNDAAARCILRQMTRQGARQCPGQDIDIRIRQLSVP